MRQSVLIIIIILFSIIGGGIGAYGVMKYMPHTITSSQPSPLGEKELATSGENVASLSSKGERIQEGGRGEKKVDLVSLENTINSTIKDIAPSVVSIIIKKDMVIYRSDPWGFFQQPAGTVNRKVGGGSGFFVRKDGTIITNKHVVQDSEAEYTVILNSGEEYSAEVIASDPVNDLAVMKISDASKEFIPLGIIEDIGDVEVGDFGIAVGNALAEFQNSVSLGIISAKDRSIEAGGDTLSGLLQTDAAINPGNSGGPLLNLEGKVIGINTAIASGSNGIGFAFALTDNRINYMLESISENDRIMRPFIGINYIPNSPSVASELGVSVDYGAYIIDEAESIVAGSSAEQAGLEPGDIILEVNDSKLDARLTLGKIIQNSLPGDILNMKILKKSGEEENIDLTLGAY